MATKNGVQTWMSQLNALTSSHRQPSLSADDRQMAKEDGESSLSRKPPQGGGKRPGTGRKLPSIPTDRSPVSSEHSSTCVLDPETAQVVDGQAGWSAASSQRILNGGHKTNGSGVASMKGKTVLDSSSSRGNKVVKNGVSNGNHSRYVSSSSPGSARSRGSVDTELLLQDTETVMAAMEARMAYRTAGRQGSSGSERRGSREDGEFDSDTDVSSTVALVNGDEEYVKPSYFTSPRDALSRSYSHTDSRRPGGGKLSREAGMASNTVSLAQSSKRPVGRSYSQTVASKSRTPTSSTASPRTPASSASAQRRSVGSDIYSGRDSVGADSLASDLGSENGIADGNLSRSSSLGKGTITMTKPNRAFQLRRARSDSVEETAAPTTPRSAKSGASARTPGSSARSSSVHSTNRTRSVLETNRSEATSLGAQIARKSRSNGAVMQSDARTSAGGTSAQKASSSVNLNRQDGGRHSLRLTRASSLTISSPSQSTAGTLPKKDSTHVSSSTSNSKSHSYSTPSGSRGNLAITGVSTSSGAVVSSRCHSNPGSRSNSPKAAERIAWRRRKEYDPRKAVAEAKAAKASGQSTGTVTMRPKPHANSRVNRRMIRSASFTNTGGSLALSLAGSVSASQELVSGPPSASDYSGEGQASASSAFRRAFLPFQAVSGRVGGHRSAHSADEDDSLLGSTRVTTTNRSSRRGSLSVVTPEPKSAFTPPPLALHHRPARRRSPSAGASGRSRSSAGFSRNGSLSLLRRRSLQGETGGYLPLSLPPRSSGDFEDELTTGGNQGYLTNGDHGDNLRSRIESPPQTSYDTLIVSSIYQLSNKLVGNTDKSLQKLRDQSRASQSPSPCEDFLNDGSGGRGEMTAFRSANQELAGVLNNLRRLERHVQVINAVLFPEDEVPTRVSAGSLPSPSTPSSGMTPSSSAGGRQGKQRYFAEIERIRSELAGFHPIGGAQTTTVPDNASSEADSPEMAELSEQF
ncbi:centrosomal protein of 170 kDa [Elysia marginata]|uniref:Centrosomal protein of 170 kDa n=1 Tax=Elysia marginata TaxID=1093978 RepID=A0AAV4G2U9_9GAST|nr:centrosomal protein of 170 kDa [Elysia marginata]